jgi:hypothetical protein
MSTAAVKDWTTLALVVLPLGMTLIELLLAGDASAQRDTRGAGPRRNQVPPTAPQVPGTPAVARAGRSEAKKEEKRAAGRKSGQRVALRSCQVRSPYKEVTS